MQNVNFLHAFFRLGLVQILFLLCSFFISSIFFLTPQRLKYVGFLCTIPLITIRESIENEWIVLYKKWESPTTFHIIIYIFDLSNCYFFTLSFFLHTLYCIKKIGELCMGNNMRYVRNQMMMRKPTGYDNCNYPQMPEMNFVECLLPWLTYLGRDFHVPMNQCRHSMPEQFFQNWINHFTEEGGCKNG